MTKTQKNKLAISDYPAEIEIKTMVLWLKTGAITEDERGSENIYFMDEFFNKFYCKCL